MSIEVFKNIGFIKRRLEKFLGKNLGLFILPTQSSTCSFWKKIKKSFFILLLGIIGIVYILYSNTIIFLGYFRQIY
jgi:hypothetical protein